MTRPAERCMCGHSSAIHGEEGLRPCGPPRTGCECLAFVSRRGRTPGQITYRNLPHAVKDAVAARCQRPKGRPPVWACEGCGETITDADHARAGTSRMGCHLVGRDHWPCGPLVEDTGQQTLL